MAVDAGEGWLQEARWLLLIVNTLADDIEQRLRAAIAAGRHHDEILDLLGYDPHVQQDW